MKKLLAVLVALGFLLTSGSFFAISADVNPDYADIPQYVTPPGGH